MHYLGKQKLYDIVYEYDLFVPMPEVDDCFYDTSLPGFERLSYPSEDDWMSFIVDDNDYSANLYVYCFHADTGFEFQEFYPFSSREILRFIEKLNEEVS